MIQPLTMCKKGAFNREQALWVRECFALALIFRTIRRNFAGKFGLQRYHNKVMKRYFFYLWLVPVGLGCGPQTPVLRQTFHCYARYDAADQQSKAEATLKEGPDEKHLVPVDPPDGIRYQGVSMHLLPVQGMTYQSTYSAAYRPDHRFSWKDKTDQPLVFEAIMPRIDSFYFDNPALSTTTPATLRWTGGTLERGETLLLLWQHPADGKTVPMEVYNTDGMNALEIPATKMAELSAGQWSLYLVRKRLTKGTVGAVDATGVAEYYTKAQTLKIKA